MDYPFKNTSDTPYNPFMEWKETMRRSNGGGTWEDGLQDDVPCARCAPSTPETRPVTLGHPNAYASAGPKYTQDFLRAQTGKMMQVEFLIGNQSVSRTGRLVEVGASYILLQSLDTRGTVMCDLDSVRFVTVME